MKWFFKKIKKISFASCSSERFVFSVCVGMYIAFSPFIFLHTVLVFFLSWLFRLNYIVVFCASSLVSNPWTALPLYALDYWFGDYLLRILLGYDSACLNPNWMQSVNCFLSTHIGCVNVSLYAFLIGGNLLGICVAGILFCVLKSVFVRKVVTLYFIRSGSIFHENNS